MAHSSDSPAPGSAARRLRFELILAGVLLAIGFGLMPLAVFLVGQQILGDYGGGLGTFYGDLYAALGRGERGAWILLTSPLIGIELLRLLVLPLRRRRGPAAAKPAEV
jgi:hypothetical protein